MKGILILKTVKMDRTPQCLLLVLTTLQHRIQEPQNQRRRTREPLLGMLGVPKLQQARVHPINHLNNVVLCIHCLPGLTPDVSEAGPPVVYKRRARGNGLIRKSTQEEPYCGYERSLLVLQTGKLRSRKEVSRSSRGVTDRPASLPGRLSLYHTLPTVRLRFFSELHERIWNLEDNTL